MARRRKVDRPKMAPDDPRRANLTNTIKPGEVRNPTGKNGSEWLTAFRDFCSQVDSAPQGRGKRAMTAERAELVRVALFRKAIRGDTQAMKIIIEQLQGRPRQSVEVSGPGGGPIPGAPPMTSAELRQELASLVGSAPRATVDPVPPSEQSKPGDDDAGQGD